MGVTAIANTGINLAVSLLTSETTLPQRPALQFPHGVFRVRSVVVTGEFLTTTTPSVGMYRITTGEDDKIVGVPVLVRQALGMSPFVGGATPISMYVAVLDELFEAVDGDQLTFILTGIDDATDTADDVVFYVEVTELG